MNDLLLCVGQAVIEQAPRALARCLPFGETLYDIAATALEIWKARRVSSAERRADLEAVAQADQASIREQAGAVAARVADPSLQGPLADYLERLPGVIRKSLSRPEDVHGRSVPARLPLNRPEDLAPFLPARPSRFRPGDQPAGMNGWVLEELLGVGGFGEVWLAHNHAGQHAALKFCLDEGAVRSLRHERDLLDRVQAENTSTSGLVRLLHSYLDLDPPCLVFEYIPGGDLTRLIHCWHESRTTPARLVHESVRLMAHLAQVVSRAHHLNPAVVHRDLKPSNILLQPTRPNYVRPCVADFGIGGISAEQTLTRLTSANEALTTGARGAYTELYASPQQKEGQPAHPTDDVFSLGVIGYQTLTGSTTMAPPVHMEDELRDLQVPDPVIALLGSCLAEEAEDRPAHAGELAEGLAELLEGVLHGS
jgi:hypothetical protein